MSEAKTWLQSEIEQIIAAELRSYRHDCVLRTRQYTNAEASELIYAALDSRGLIEHTP